MRKVSMNAGLVPAKHRKAENAKNVGTPSRADLRSLGDTAGLGKNPPAGINARRKAFLNFN